MPYPAGTLVIDDVKNAIYDWIASVMDGVVLPGAIIWRNQTEPLPRRPCITMKIIDGPRPTDRNAVMINNAKGDPFTMGIQHEMIVSIQIFSSTECPSPGALQLGLDLNSSLLRQSVLDQLKHGGVAIQGLGQLTNLTALEESQYEERSGFEISCGLVQNVIDKPGTVGTINLELETDEGTVTRAIVLP